MLVIERLVVGIATGLKADDAARSAASETVVRRLCWDGMFMAAAVATGRAMKRRWSAWVVGCLGCAVASSAAAADELTNEIESGRIYVRTM